MILTLNRREQLIENYEDALMALFMDHVAEYEGEKLTECSEIIEPEEFSISPELDRRCLAEINNAEYKRKLRSFKKHAYSVVNKVAIVVLASLVLFTSAYAAFPEVRASTLNLLIEISERSTALRFGTAETETADAENIISEYSYSGIPEGFTLQSSKQTSKGLRDFYSNADGDYILIKLNYGNSGRLSVNTEGANSVEEFILPNFQGLLIDRGAEVIVVLSDAAHETFITLTCNGLAKNDVLGIAESFTYNNN